MTVRGGIAKGLSLTFAHAFEEIPRLVVFGGVGLAEPVKICELVAGFRRAAVAMLPATGPLTNAFVRRRFVLGRLDTDILEARFVVEGFTHGSNYGDPTVKRQ